MTREQIIEEIEEFAAARGISPSTVTSKAVANSRLYARMKSGGSCNLETVERLRDFIRGATGGAAKAAESSGSEGDATARSASEGSAGGLAGIAPDDAPARSCAGDAA